MPLRLRKLSALFEQHAKPTPERIRWLLFNAITLDDESAQTVKKHLEKQ